MSSQDTDYQGVAERLHLPFLMLSDPALRLASAIGVPGFQTGGLTLYKRLTLIIRDSVIEHLFYPAFPSDTHAQQVLSWLRDNAR